MRSDYFGNPFILKLLSVTIYEATAFFRLSSSMAKILVTSLIITYELSGDLLNVETRNFFC